LYLNTLKAIDKISDCPRKKVIRALKKLGLDLKEGKRHTKATSVHSGKITMIPRYRTIKKPVLRDILAQVEAVGFDKNEFLKSL
jgi:hypothetical protein